MATTETENRNGGELPTLHHLNNSQSQRILWLIEELEIPYNLSLYERDPKEHRAPPSLLAIHPLGKSPLLELPDKRVISESSAIATCLLRNYDTQGRFASSDWINDEILTSFAGATLGPTVAVELLFDIAEKVTPWPFRFIASAVRKGVQKTYTAAELNKTLAFLEKELGDKPWFNGEQLGRSDVMLIWNVDIMAQRGWVDFEKRFPLLGAWRGRILERDAWKRGLEKGNGYNLNAW